MNRRLFLSLASLAGLLIAPLRRPLSEVRVSASPGTGLLYDAIFLDHWLEPGHPESPQRLRAVHSAFQQAGLLDQVRLLEGGPDAQDWIRTIHTASHVESIRRDYPRAHRVTSQVVSGVLRAVNSVCNGELRNAFCATRPPGHHAENTGREEGFCFYNMVAIAARYAQRQFGFERILIVDWDYHHGNGTESAFYTDPSVLFFSTHDLYAYPGTGHPDRTGSGAGEGFNINVHLPCGTTDRKMIDAFMQRLIPAANSFKPDLILISAGFDSREGDLLGCYEVTDEGFRELTRIVMRLADKHCQGRIVSVLEGGYTPAGLASACVTHVQTLCGKDR